MPTTHPLVRVQTAQRRGSDSKMQDRIFRTPNAVIVLDGASDPDATDSDGGWIAEQIGRRLAQTLHANPEEDLARALSGAIAAVSTRYSLSPSTSPSTTVNIVRWTTQHIDVLVLGDSPVIVQTTTATFHELRDNRLRQLQRRAQFDAASPSGPSKELELHRGLIRFERSARNRPGGYWIAEADPDAAGHATQQRWPRAEVRAVLALTNGVADGVDVYAKPIDWESVLRLAAADTKELVDLVHRTEEMDPGRTRWPRHKQHDDKSAATVVFRDA